MKQENKYVNVLLRKLDSTQDFIQSKFNEIKNTVIWSISVSFVINNYPYYLITITSTYNDFYFLLRIIKNKSGLNIINTLNNHIQMANKYLDKYLFHYLLMTNILSYTNRNRRIMII